MPAQLGKRREIAVRKPSRVRHTTPVFTCVSEQKSTGSKEMKRQHATRFAAIAMVAAVSLGVTSCDNQSGLNTSKPAASIPAYPASARPQRPQAPSPSLRRSTTRDCYFRPATSPAPATSTSTSRPPRTPTAGPAPRCSSSTKTRPRPSASCSSPSTTPPPAPQPSPRPKPASRRPSPPAPAALVRRHRRNRRLRQLPRRQEVRQRPAVHRRLHPGPRRVRRPARPARLGRLHHQRRPEAGHRPARRTAHRSLTTRRHRNPHQILGHHDVAGEHRGRLIRIPR